jgi:hypothetical protein
MIFKLKVDGNDTVVPAEIPVTDLKEIPAALSTLDRSPLYLIRENSCKSLPYLHQK